MAKVGGVIVGGESRNGEDCVDGGIYLLDIIRKISHRIEENFVRTTCVDLVFVNSSGYFIEREKLLENSSFFKGSVFKPYKVL